MRSVLAAGRPFWPYGFCLACLLPLLLFRLGDYPEFWFDEGYKLNAAWTLAERGVYGTWSVNGLLPFDPGTSSGPADLGLTALSLKLLGMGVVQARLASVAFTLLLAGALLGLAAALYGRRPAAGVVLAVAALPAIQGVNLVMLGRQMLSESAALALILTGWWLWWRSWPAQRGGRAWAAGALIGLGLLSKTQIALSLLPALTLLGLALWWKQRLPARTALAPSLASLGVYGAWTGLGQWLTPAPLRAENAARLNDAIRSNLLVWPAGRVLPAGAGWAAGLIALAVLLTVWRLARRPAGQRLSQDAHWLEAGLAGFAALNGLWFLGFSVGWPRYAYAGLVVSGALLAGGVWEAGRPWVSRWLGSARWRRVALLMGLAAALGPQWVSLARFEPTTQVAAAADYLRQTVPPAAVVETWEWGLAPLSGHWHTHFPPQALLFSAIRQSSHGHAFQLAYDPLSADPDYLVTGPFSEWTQLYPAPALRAHFVEVRRIGSYVFYQRRRP